MSPHVYMLPLRGKGHLDLKVLATKHAGQLLTETAKFIATWILDNGVWKIKCE